jgi:TolB-like protein/Flp pilus assembly protein TadD
MAGKPDRFSRFWQELKRRKTDRVIVVYAAAVFALLQLIQILQDALSLPGWTTKLILIISVVGFPIVAVFSWFFDITPGLGIEKTKPLEETEREKIDTQLRTWRTITLASIIVIILLLLFNVIRSGIESNDIKNSEKTIAVIPFKNLSPKEDLLFPPDLVASIINNGLVQIKVFDVTSRFNILQFNTENKSVSDIAKGLKVIYLVTGEMLKNRNQTIVSINLIRANKNKTIWGDKYIFDNTDNIDTLNDIAIRIADKLKTALSPELKQKIKSKPTKNRMAYLNYLKGSAFQDDAIDASKYISRGDSSFKGLPTADSYEKAISFYDKAILEDSTFALAYAKRAITRAYGFRAEYFTEKDHKKKCADDVNNALRINKNLIESRIAAGFYFYCFTQEYNKALEYFGEALKMDHDNWQCKFSLAVVYRAAGNWEQSQIWMKEVGKDDPRDALILTNVGLSYQYLRNFDSAIYYQDKAIRVMPGWTAPYSNKIDALIMRDGNTREAEIVLDSAYIKTNGRFMRKYKVIFDIYNGRLDEALLKTEVADPSDFHYPGERYLLYAQIYEYLKNRAFSDEYYRKALDNFNNLLAEKPGNTEITGDIGIAWAGLNDRMKAIEYGQEAIDLANNDVIYRNLRIKDLAIIYVMLGENKKSLELLKELVKNPSDLSYKVLQLDPVWKPLWNMPEFKKLASEYSKTNSFQARGL